MLYKTRLSELAVPVNELGRLSLPTQVRPPTLHNIFCPGYIYQQQKFAKRPNLGNRPEIVTIWIPTITYLQHKAETVPQDSQQYTTCHNVQLTA